jgi:arginyl-tRNA synthetase
LKYFILKVDPKKNMVFDPKESIDFNGNTGPFIQYTYARINSILRKAADAGIISDVKQASVESMGDKEKELIKLLYDFPMLVQEAAKEFSPAIIANFCYDLAKEYNQFYHDCPILKENDNAVRNLRLALSQQVALAIGFGMKLLGIDVPERM